MRDLARAAVRVQTFLDKQRWKYCFIGGIAVQKRGHVRITNDIDLTVLTGFGAEEKYIECRRHACHGWILLHSLMLTLLFAVPGCTGATESGQNPALNGSDLIRMTDDMAISIQASPAARQAIANSGSMKIVVEPVVNQMTAEVLPAGPADEFTGRVRTLLSRRGDNQFVWIMNLSAFRRLRGLELEGIDAGPSPEAMDPQYALTATFTSITNETDQSRASYYVCNYSLTNLGDRTVLWTKSYEVQKRAVKGFLD